MVDMTELILSWWLHFNNIIVYVTVHFCVVQQSSLLCTSMGLKIVPFLSKALIVYTSGDQQELYKEVDKLCFSERIVQIMGLVCITFCIEQLILKLYTEIIIGHSNNNLL